MNSPVTIAAFSDATIRQAAELLRQGRLVAFPTETVYGLGADATNGLAVAAIYEAKGRPSFNPLIVHIPGIALAEKLAVFNSLALNLAAAFWPGPLTLVLPRRAESGISELVTAGLDTIAVRVPSHPAALALLIAAGRPVAAPSANRSGHVSPTRAEHVEADLGSKVALIIDGGACQRGLESTVVALTSGRPRLLRRGALLVSDVEKVLGAPLVRDLHRYTGPSSPGQLESHYAPAARLRLNVSRPEAGEAFLAFGPSAPEVAGPMFNLSPRGDLLEAAANLFAALRSLDAAGAPAIAVMPIPNTGLGEAINDRLIRAAAPRTS
jgi:L-threonylcarbamoyladenylate synthase